MNIKNVSLTYNIIERSFKTMITYKIYTLYFKLFNENITILCILYVYLITIQYFFHKFRYLYWFTYYLTLINNKYCRA